MLLDQAFAFTPRALNDIISHLQGWGLQFPWIICATSPKSFQCHLLASRCAAAFLSLLRPLARQFGNRCLLRYIKFQAKAAWKLQPRFLWQGVLGIVAIRGGSCTIALKEKSIYVFYFCSSEVLKALQKNNLLVSWCAGRGIIFNYLEQFFKRSLYVP